MLWRCGETGSRSGEVRTLTVKARVYTRKARRRAGEYRGHTETPSNYQLAQKQDSSKSNGASRNHIIAIAIGKLTGLTVQKFRRAPKVAPTPLLLSLRLASIRRCNHCW